MRKKRRLNRVRFPHLSSTSRARRRRNIREFGIPQFLLATSLSRAEEYLVYRRKQMEDKIIKPFVDRMLGEGILPEPKGEVEVKW